LYSQREGLVGLGKGVVGGVVGVFTKPAVGCIDLISKVTLIPRKQILSLSRYFHIPLGNMLLIYGYSDMSTKKT
tara:strand:+ start:727 stop:948 length:222 start_codon:yes stop_codon:yes gene_type:complete